MKFELNRDVLLKALQAVQGAVERRQAYPILANLLLEVGPETLRITGTDMELELVASVGPEDLRTAQPGETTISARKCLDICRALPAGANVVFEAGAERATIRSGRSRFTLATLPAEEFPASEQPDGTVELVLPAAALKRLVDLTQFAMAHQDVRYYLNGLLLEFRPGAVRAVATDGHRLAIAELPLAEEAPAFPDPAEGEGSEAGLVQVILPRKGVLELGRLLGAHGDGEVRVTLGQSFARVSWAEITFTSKLVDGRFPDYERVVPLREDCDKELVADRETLRQSLARAAILSNEKYRAVRLQLEGNTLRVATDNPEQEEAEEELEVDYRGAPLEIGFNVSYLLDALGTVPSEQVSIALKDAASSALIEPAGEGAEGAECRYVVMPMRL